MTYARTYLTHLNAVLESIPEAELEQVIDLLWDNYQGQRRVLFCGNGGSASTASHLVADFQKNMFLDGQRPWECLAVVDSVPLLTAWSNDTNYANVFAGQVRCWLRPNDILLAISGSGNSPNILAAVEAATEIGATTVGFCGYGGGRLAGLVTHPLVLQSRNMQMVEDVHLIWGHILYSALRDRLLGQELKA